MAYWATNDGWFVRMDNQPPLPEFPEAEITHPGLALHLDGRPIHGVILRREDLH